MSETNPAGVSTPGVRNIPGFTHDGIDDAMSDVAQSKTPEREGLPSAYKMRADAHYVDQLLARPDGDRHVPAREAPRAAVRAEPEAGAAVASNVVRDVPVQPVTSGGSDLPLLGVLESALLAISASAVQLSPGRSALARRANLDVVSAEAWRALWAIRAAALVEGRESGHMRSRPVAALLAEVRERFAPEFRLSGRPLTVIATDWNTPTDADASGLVTAIAGAVIATLGVLQDVEAAEAGVRITVRTASGALQAIDVSQDEVTVSDGVVRRIFEADWTERPGGFPAGLGARAVRAFMRRSGGDAVMSGGRRGSTFRLVFDPLGSRA